MAFVSAAAAQDSGDMDKPGSTDMPSSTTVDGATDGGYMLNEASTS